MPAKKKEKTEKIEVIHRNETPRVVQKRRIIMPVRLDALKFGIAGGILGALFVILMTVAAMYGVFEKSAELIADMYGIFGYNLSVLGILLGAIFGFIDCFIFFGLLAALYNWLT